MLKHPPPLPGLFRVTCKQFSRLRGIAVVTLLTLGLVLTYLLTTTPLTANAATNNTLNFQARLETAAGAIVPDGNYDVTFHLYNALSSSGSTDTACNTDTNCLWEETYSYNSGAGATDARLHVANGYMTVNLGSLTSFPTTINWDQSLWLSMDIGGTTSSGVITWDGQMSPRLALTAVPYAFRAGSLATGNGTNSSTLTLLQPASSTQVFQVPDQGAAGTYNLLTGGNVSGAIAGIVLQSSSPGTQQTGNFNVSGTGIAGTALQTPTLDTPSGTSTLNIGKASGGNASNIQLNLNTQIGTGTISSATPHFLFISEVSSNANGNALITGNWQSSKNWGIGPNSNSSTDNTLRIGTTTAVGGNVWATNANLNLLVAGTERITPTTGNDSATAFQVQNASGSDLLDVDTTNQNLITNSDFEQNTTGWAASGSGASIAQNLTWANIYQGYASLAVTLGSGSGTGVAITNSGYTGASIAAGTYIFSFYAKASSALSGLAVSGFTGATCTLNNTTVSTSGFQLYTCTFTTTGATTGNINITTTTASQTLYIDGVTLTTTANFNNAYGNIQLRGFINDPLILLNKGNSSNELSVQNASGLTLFNVDSTNNSVTVSSPTASTKAFQVQNASGGNILVVDTSNGRVGIGNGAAPNRTLTVAPAANATAIIGIQSTAGAGSEIDLGANGGYQSAIGYNRAISGALEFMVNGTTPGTPQASGNTVFTLNSNGSALFQNNTNSTTAFQVQNAAGEALLNVDTTNATNLVSNPDGAAGPSSPPTGWTATGTGASATRNTSSADIYSGLSSVQDVTGTTANGGAEVTGFTSAITPGTYSLSFYAATASGSFTDLSVTFVGGGTAACATSSTTNSPSTTVGTGFNNYYCTFTSTSTNITGIIIGESGTTTHTFYLDGVQLVTGSSPTFDYTNGTVQILGNVASPMTFQNTNNTNNAFQINRQSGQTIFAVDTAANHVMAGSVSACEDITLTGQFCVGQNLSQSGSFANNKNVLNITGSAGSTDTGMQFVLDDTGTGSDTVQGVVIDSTSGNSGGGSSNTAATINSIIANVPSANPGSLLQLQSASSNVFAVSNTGATTLKNQANSTAALQVQNASGSKMFNVDTTGSSIMVGGSNPSSTVSTSGTWEADGLGTNKTTQSITTHNVGNLVTVAVEVPSSSFTVLSVTGGDSGSWYNAVNKVNTTSGDYVSLWVGTVTTVGTANVTVTYSATTGLSNQIVEQEFTAGLGSGTKWVVSSTGTATSATTATTYPSLTTNQANQLYWGFTSCNGTAANGSTPGFSWKTTTASDQTTWNPALSADTAYQPTATCSASGSTSAALVVSAYTTDTSMTVTGSTTIANNSTSAFSVQNTGGTSLFNVDATNNTVTLLQNAQISSSSAGACGTNYNLDVTDSLTNPTNSVRWRTNACGANLESGGVDMYLSGWTGGGFTGTQEFFLRGYIGTAANSYADGGLFVGNASGSAAPELFVLANKNTSGDPAFEFDGGMYYNSAVNSFECGTDGQWEGCQGLVSALDSGTILGPKANTTESAFTGTGSTWTALQNDCQQGVVYHITGTGHATSATAGFTLNFFLQDKNVTAGTTSDLGTGGIHIGTDSTYTFDIFLTCTGTGTGNLAGNLISQYAGGNLGGNVGVWGQTGFTLSNSAGGDQLGLAIQWSSAPGSGNGVYLTQFIIQRLSAP